MRVDGRDISVSGSLLQPLTRRTNDIIRLVASVAFFAILIAGSLITRPQWVALERSISQIVGVLTKTFGATKVNELRFGYRDWENNEGFPTPSQCGNPCLGGAVPGLAALSLPQISMVGSSNFAAGGNGKSVILDVGILLGNDPDFTAGARLAGSSSDIGHVDGAGRSDPMTFTLLGSRATMKVGDRLVTFASIGDRPFVPEVPIGHITSVRPTAGQLFSLTQRILMTLQSKIPTVDDELSIYRRLTELIAEHDADGAEQAMLEHLFSGGEIAREGVRLD